MSDYNNENFKVIKPNKEKFIIWIFILSFLVFIPSFIWIIIIILDIFNVIVFIFYIVYTYIFIFCFRFIWKYFGKKLTKYEVFKISKYLKNNSKNLKYLLDINAKNIDLNNIGSFIKSKFPSVIIGTIALPAIIGTSLEFFLLTFIRNNYEALYAIILFLTIFFSSFLIGILLVYIWILNDGGLLEKKEKNIYINKGYFIRSKPLKLFFGISGIILSIKYYHHLIFDYFLNHIASIILLLLLVWVPIISLITAFLYIYSYHEKLVSDFRRMIMSKGIKSGYLDLIIL